MPESTLPQKTTEQVQDDAGALAAKLLLYDDANDQLTTDPGKFSQTDAIIASLGG